MRKLTNWRNEPTAEDLLEDLALAKPSYYEQQAKIENWLKTLNVQSDLQRMEQEGKSGIVFKLTKIHTEWQINNLIQPFYRTPKLFKIIPHNMEDIEIAIQQDAIVNFQFDHQIDKSKFLDELVTTVVTEGTAILRVGWERQTAEVEVEEEVYKIIDNPEEHEINQINGAMMGETENYLEDHIKKGTLLKEHLNSDFPNYHVQPEMPAPAVSPEQIQQTRDELSKDPAQAFAEDMGFDEPLQPQLAAELQPTVEAPPMLPPEVLQASVKKSMELGKPVVAYPTGRTKKVIKEVTVKNHPVVRVVSNDSIIIDPNCEEDFSKANFVCYVFDTCLAELKAQKDIYKNLYKIERYLKAEQYEKLISDDVPSNIPLLLNEEHNFKDYARRRLKAVEYWGYWDIHGNGTVRPIVATFIGEVMIRLEENPFPDESFPFIVVPYKPVKKSVYGEPDADILDDFQKLLTSTHRATNDIYAKSAAGQRGIPKGLLDSENQKRFSQGFDYLYNPIGGTSRDLIITHTASEPPTSMINYSSMLLQQAEGVTGVKAFTNGLDELAFGSMSPETGSSMFATTIRQTNYLRRIIKGLEEVCHKFVMMNQAWQEPGDISDVVKTVVKVDTTKRRYLNNFYSEAKVLIDNESIAKANKLLMLLQTLGNTVDFTITKSLLASALQLYGETSLAKAVAAFQPQPDPMEQQLKQAEVAEAVAKGKKLEAEIARLGSEAAFYDARTDYINTQATKDRVGITKEITGTAHAEKVDLAQSQALAQGEAKMAENGDREAKRAMRSKRNRPPKPVKEAMDELGQDAVNSSGYDSSTGTKGIPNVEDGSNFGGAIDQSLLDRMNPAKGL